jgi:hypothetical protein
LNRQLSPTDDLVAIEDAGLSVVRKQEELEDVG